MLLHSEQLKKKKKFNSLKDIKYKTNNK